MAMNSLTIIKRKKETKDMKEEEKTKTNLKKETTEKIIEYKNRKNNECGRHERIKETIK